MVGHNAGRIDAHTSFFPCILVLWGTKRERYMKFKVLGDTKSNGMVVRSASWEGFTLKLLRPSERKHALTFWLAEVSKGATLCWKFGRNHPQFRGHAELIDFEGEYIIALITRESRLDMVIPVRDLPGLRQTNSGDFIWIRPDIAMSQLREKIAKQLTLPAVPKFATHVANAKQMRGTGKQFAIRGIQVDKDDKRRAELRQEREEKAKKILSRERFLVKTLLYGYAPSVPVVKTEWKTLPINTPCVLVDTFNETAGTVGSLIESFTVQRGAEGMYRESICNLRQE